MLKQMMQHKNVLNWQEALLLLAIITLYAPIYFTLFTQSWRITDQSYGWLVLLIVIYLFWQHKHVLSQHIESTTLNILALIILLIGLSMYVIGRSQSIPALTVASQIPVLVAFLMQFKGNKVARQFWFPLTFLAFTIPFPAQIIDAITLPLKIAVSYVTELVLYYADYPIGRNGVILQIGNYQLLVADACAGMKTLMSLEAMGLLYLNIVHHDSWQRNLILAILILPISFLANVIRVITLALITFHFGDAVGQGFIHKFAGLLLFMIALSLIMFIDHNIQKHVSRN